MTPELENALDVVMNLLEEQPRLLGKWDMADLTEMIRDVRQHGPSATGWHQEDIDHLLDATHILNLDPPIAEAVKLVLNNA